MEDVAQKNLKMALKMSVGDKRYNIIYADTVCLLFEGIARIIEVHQPLIETYYGPGRLLLAVNILQQACDKQMKFIMQELIKTRNINNKITQVNDLSRMSGSSSFNKLERIDPKDLDVLIGEIAAIHARAEAYINFIKNKVMVSLHFQTFKLSYCKMTLILLIVRYVYHVTFTVHVS